MVWAGGVSWSRPDPCMVKASLFSREAALLACYPQQQGCYSRLASLAYSGLEAVCTRGPLILPGGVGALGKGHSSVVFGAVYRGVNVAVKSRRPDGRRSSLEPEARLIEMASRAGVAPRVYFWSRDFIVMDYIPGPSLAEIMEEHGRPPSWALQALLEAASTLDFAGILHYELHRPWWNVFYTTTPRPQALVIDFDSAGPGCGNVAKVASALVHLGLLELEPRVRGLLGSYKKECSVDSIRRVLGLLYDSLHL